MLFVSEKKKEKLAEIIKENQVALYRMAYSYVHHEETAKDIVQETVLAAFSHISSLKDEDYMKTWLFRICINKSIDRTRKKQKPTENVVELKDYQAKTSSFNLFEHSDLFQAVMKLEPKLRTVIILRFFEEMKFEEIAQATNTNVNTVKSQVYKALNELKFTLEKEEQA